LVADTVIFFIHNTLQQFSVLCAAGHFFHLELKLPVEQPYKFWEVEEDPKNQSSMSPDECSVVQHLSQNHTHTEAGRFAVPP